MKRLFVISGMIFCLSLASGTAMADSLKGRIGVTGRFGFLAPSDSKVFGRNLDTDVGFIGGGGFIFGIDKNFAVELDITHTKFDANINSTKVVDFETTNISLGAQYRFVDLPGTQLVPYLGVGVDILLNDSTDRDGDTANLDTVPGIHVNGGVDFFVLKQLALTAELKGVLAPDADIKVGSSKVGDYDPTSLSMTFGFRYLFN